MGEKRAWWETLSMKKVLILVEGPTEEQFIKTVVYPYLQGKDIFVTPIILRTKYVKCGPDFKGGVRSYNQVKRDLLKLLIPNDSALISTMLDYYALPTDFPGKSTSHSNCYESVKEIETAIITDIGARGRGKLFPYIQLHEFEALIFSSIEHLAKTFRTNDGQLKELKAIIAGFPNPEYINDRPETCPNRRLAKIYPEYKKVIYGTIITSKIGLPRLREKCPHFNEWLTKLESL